MKEITYNGSLVREMRAIYLITKMIDDGIIKDPSVKNFHDVNKLFEDLDS